MVNLVARSLRDKLVPSADEVAAVRDAGVLVVYGGWDAELDISLGASSAVQQSLAAFEIDYMTITLDDPKLRDHLLHDSRCVLNLANGRLAEGGALVGAREMAGLPFAGSPAASSALALNKHVSTLLFRAGGLPVPRTIYVGDDPEALPPQGEKDVLVSVAKPADAGSSVGVALCHGRTALKKAVTDITSGFGQCLVQEFMTGREFSVGVIEDRNKSPIAFPPIEAFPGDGVMSAATKYTAPTKCPAAASRKLICSLQQLAVRAHALLGLRGYSRADIRLDANNVPRLLEINHTPGMTVSSWFPIGAAAAGLDHADVVVRLLTNGLSLTTNLPRARHPPACSPGPDKAVILVGSTTVTGNTVRSAVLNIARRGDAILSIKDLPDWLATVDPGRVVIETTYGAGPENAAIRGALDLARCRRTGPSILGAALAQDKFLHRLALQALGVPVPNGVLATASHLPGPGPWVLKPRRGCQSLGVQLCQSRQELLSITHAMSSFDPEQWIIEAFIEGPEYATCTICEDGRLMILPTLQIPVASHAIFTTAQKDNPQHPLTAIALDDTLESQITMIIMRLHRLMGRPAMSRLEWRLGRGRRPCILEYDILPGAGDKSCLTIATRTAGIDLSSAMRRWAILRLDEGSVAP